MSGKSIFVPARAGPIHTAAPIPSVSVGVTNIRTVFVGIAIHREPHAEFGQHTGPGTYQSFEAGYTVGKQHGLSPHVVCFPVRALKIGIHSSIRGPSPTAVQSMTGSFPGASGAQFIGKLRHHHHQKPHERPSAIFCIIVSTSCSTHGLNPRERRRLSGSRFHDISESELSEL